MAGKDVLLTLIGKDQTKAATNSAANNFDRLGKKLDQANVKNGKFAAKFAGAGAAIQRGSGLVIAGMVGIGIKSIKMAAQAEQSIGSVETVFGKYAKTVIDSSKKASTAVGLSADEYRTAATLIGAQLKNQGVAQDKLGQQTDKLIRLGADFSSMFGGTAAEAVDALSSALKGEFDPIEKYGVTLKQSTINAEAFRIAHVKTASEFGKLSVAAQAAAKRQATLNLIFAQGKDSVGNFGREANTASHKAQVLAARAKDLGVKLGNDLLPVALDMADAAAKLAKWLEKDDKNIRLLSEGVGLTALSIKSFKAGPLVGALVSIGSALELLSIQFPAFNDAIVQSNMAAKEDLQSLLVFWLGVIDKILTAWATISPFVRGAQRAVHKELLAAQGDLDATHKKWDKTAQEIKNRPIIAKLKADKTDAEAKLKSIKSQLKDPNLTKARKAKLQADKKQAEAAIASIKSQLNALNGKTATVHVNTVYKKIITTINKSGVKSGNNAVPAAGDHWAGAAGGISRTGGPRQINVEAPIIDTRVFIDGSQIRTVARSTVVDENRRAAHRARVGRR